PKARRGGPPTGHTGCGSRPLHRDGDTTVRRTDQLSVETAVPAGVSSLAEGAMGLRRHARRYTAVREEEIAEEELLFGLRFALRLDLRLDAVLFHLAQHVAHVVHLIPDFLGYGELRLLL